MSLSLVFCSSANLFALVCLEALQHELFAVACPVASAASKSFKYLFSVVRLPSSRLAGQMLRLLLI